MNKMKRDYTKPYLEETDVYLNDVVLNSGFNAEKILKFDGDVDVSI